MPFQRGVAPIRHTLEYLNRSKLYLKPFIRIFSLNYADNLGNHKGAQDFAFWNLCQLQYKNPEVQVITFKELTPTPFIRAFTNSGKEILLDIDHQTRDEIQSRVLKTLCKSEEELEEEKRAEEILKSQNPAHFGFHCERHCICEVPGQISCSALVPLPYKIRGKYKFGFSELEESKYL